MVWSDRGAGAISFAGATNCEIVSGQKQPTEIALDPPGARIYWLCGATLVAAGYALARAQATPELAAFTGSAVEAGFALALFRAARREMAGAESRREPVGDNTSG